jgi:hypothetical protein
MRIVNYQDNPNLNEIESLAIMIKAIPFENGFVPAFVIISPDDDYSMSIDEINALMDGVEIAQTRLDEIIDYILRNKVFNRLANATLDGGEIESTDEDETELEFIPEDEEGEDDLGTSD